MRRSLLPAFLRARPRVAEVDEEHERYKKRALRATLETPVDPDYKRDLEARLLHSWLTPDGVVVDVGANAGSYAAVVEQVVGSRSVVLVEPLPQLASVLRERFPASRVVNAALSDHRGRATIRVPSIDGRQHDTRATLNDHDEPGQSGVDEIDVELRTLDDLVDELGLRRLDLLKVDVEGHEPELLAGAQETLRRLRPTVLIEIEARHHTFPLTDVFAQLEAQGMSGWLLDPRTMTVRAVRDFDPAADQDLAHLVSKNFIRYLNNFWFVPVDREAEFVRDAAAFLDALEPLDGPRPGRR